MLTLPYEVLEKTSTKSSVVIPSVTIREKPMVHLIEYIVPAMMGVTAIILLIAGGRLLKPALGLSGFLIGAGAGLIVAPELTGQVSPLIVAGIVGVVLSLLFVMAAKFAIIITLGISFAIATPYITWQITGLRGGAAIASDVIEAATTTPAESPQETSLDIAIPTSVEQIITRSFSTVWNEVNSTISTGMDRANAAWEVIPTGIRFMLVGSGIAGLLLGLLVATFMPFTASAIVTSAGGSLLLIVTVKNLFAEQFSQDFSSMTPTVFIIITATIALAGLVLQLTVFKHPPEAKLKKKN